ncbi:MAG: hypothetical protein NTW25_15285 [Candidatus Kapabacteria bacterium]|nr:hypothetical protein [Candidatus Kapabacteria bacterium]
MKKIISNILIIILIFSLITSKAFCFYIIVNKANPIKYIDKNYLKNIFLGHSVIWPNNTKIQLVDYNIDSDSKSSFCSTYLDVTPNKLSRIWLQVSLSGKAVPPKVFSSEKEVIRFVNENQSAIGYVESNKNLSDDVKIIQVKE